MNTHNTAITADDFIGQRARRLEKLKKLQEAGIDPYPASATKDYPNLEILENHDQFAGKKVSLTGRIISWREHGKLIFADILDQSGKIQLFIRQEQYRGMGGLSWEQLALLDVGDFVEATGEVGKTTRGEISLFVDTIRLLTKSIRPLPTSISEKEEQFRRRYLDLVLHPQRRELFMRKAKFWEANRAFMKQKGFVEVETPVLEHVTGGADARPFTTHHRDLDESFYLRISTELFQKRLIGGGFEKIYTLAPNFRNEGISEEHLQEYYQLEWYWAYADYRQAMELVKEMFRYIAQEVYGKTVFTTREHTYDLAHEWQEIDYAYAIQERFGIDIFKTSDNEMKQLLDKEGVYLSGIITRNRLVDNLWKLIRKTVSGPAFLINEPAFMSPLAKSKPDNPGLTQRFHVILGGSELANGYSELNNPLDQLERFIDQQKARELGDEEAQMLDVDYVEMLEYGMPPTAGYGHSERLFWFFENVTAREGTLFPLMKHELHPLTRKVYGEDIVKYTKKSLSK